MPWTPTTYAIGARLQLGQRKPGSLLPGPLVDSATVLPRNLQGVRRPQAFLQALQESGCRPVVWPLLPPGHPGVWSMDVTEGSKQQSVYSCGQLPAEQGCGSRRNSRVLLGTFWSTAETRITELSLPEETKERQLWCPTRAPYEPRRASCGSGATSHLPAGHFCRGLCTGKGRIKRGSSMH